MQSKEIVKALRRGLFSNELLQIAADKIEELENKSTEWINVKDRLPEEEGWYLVYTIPDKKHKSINKAEFCKGYKWNEFEPFWRGSGGHWGNVAYWMPLPEPPKNDFKEN